jgi:16S rRNA (uracil1498-N3)-methyltransferase
MQRFFLPPEQTRGETLTLSDREAHHALHVVRLRPGEIVMVLNGQGERLLCTAGNFGKRHVELRVTEREQVPSPAWKITLIQAVPKGKVMDSIVQKATELGTHRIIPLLSARAISQIDPERSESKMEHWNAIAIEAAKQCGSPWLPRIETPVTPKDLLQRGEPFDLALLGSLRAGARHPRVCFEEFRARAQSPASLPAMTTAPATVAFWIGPEGDFTPEELDAIEASGACPISLGPLVLRSDTAAIYCLSVVNYARQARGASPA